MAGFGNGYPYGGGGPGRAVSGNAFHTHNYGTPVAGSEMARTPLSMTGSLANESDGSGPSSRMADAWRHQPSPIATSPASGPPSQSSLGYFASDADRFVFEQQQQRQQHHQLMLLQQASASLRGGGLPPVPGQLPSYGGQEYFRAEHVAPRQHSSTRVHQAGDGVAQFEQMRLGVTGLQSPLTAAPQYLGGSVHSMQSGGSLASQGVYGSGASQLLRQPDSWALSDDAASLGTSGATSSRQASVENVGTPRSTKKTPASKRKTANVGRRRKGADDESGTASEEVDDSLAARHVSLAKAGVSKVHRKSRTMDEVQRSRTAEQRSRQKLGSTMEELISAMPKNRHRANGNTKAAALMDAVDFLKGQEATVEELGNTLAALIREESSGDAQPYLSFETVELWSPSLSFMYVDDNWQRLFGHILSDVIGKPVDSLLPSSEAFPRAGAAFASAVQCLKHESNEWRGVFYAVRKDKQYLASAAHITSCYDDEDQLTQYMCKRTKIFVLSEGMRSEIAASNDPGVMDFLLA